MSKAGKYRVTGGDLHFGNGTFAHHGDEVDLSEEDATTCVLAGTVVPVGATKAPVPTPDPKPALVSTAAAGTTTGPTPDPKPETNDAQKPRKGAS